MMKKAFLIMFSFILAFCLSVRTSAEDLSKIAKVYRYKKNDNMQIALTFDDGPHPIYTEQILEILRKYNVKATFFMIGENIIQYSDVALKVKNEGHEIGNHTQTHQNNLGQKGIMREIINCSETIFNTLDCETTIIRPPEGLVANSMLECCSLLEYSIILWNIDTRDWAMTPAREIYNNVIKNVDSGDIILMHDYISRRSPTPEALDLILPKLLADGFEFVTVTELIHEQEDKIMNTTPSEFKYFITPKARVA